MSNTQPSRGDDLLASETISELRNWIEAFVPRPKRAVILVDRLAFLLSEASAARGLLPISETSEGGEQNGAEMLMRELIATGKASYVDPSAPATPAPAGDEARSFEWWNTCYTRTDKNSSLFLVEAGQYEQLAQQLSASRRGAEEMLEKERDSLRKVRAQRDEVNERANSEVVKNSNLRAQLSKVRKELQEMTAKYLMATSPTKPI